MAEVRKIKRCPKCGIEKFYDGFYKNKRKKDGLQVYCRDCWKENAKNNAVKMAQKKYYEHNKEKINMKKRKHKKVRTNEVRKKQREIQYKYRKNNMSKEILRHSKQRAKKNGLMHTITENDIQNALDKCKNEKGKYICPIFGFEIKYNIGKGKQQDDSISLDRIDNNKGYVPDNIIVISWRANYCKNNSTIEELEKIVRFYKKLLDN